MITLQSLLSQITSKTNPISLIKSNKCATGVFKQYSHESSILNSSMQFTIFFPIIQESLTGVKGTMFWLSGLTCTDENFVQKSGVAQWASQLNLAIVICDTSPRHPDDDDVGDWTFGKSAGWYVNANESSKYYKHYQMSSYVSIELPALLNLHFNLDLNKCSIFGHSMGGHGALVHYLQGLLETYNGVEWKHCSVFAPITSPSTISAGKSAFEKFGLNEEDIVKYDATRFLQVYGDKIGDKIKHKIIIDQGSEDEFITDFLKYKNFESVVKSDVNLSNKFDFRLRDGYDHSYFYISTFINQHLMDHSTVFDELNRSKSPSIKNVNKTNFETTGKPIKCRAAIAFAPKQPLVTEEIYVAPPKEGEIRIKVVANALCHTDAYTLGGEDPEGLFPSILGHEAGGIVESVGPNVTSVSVGDHVVPCYTPQCNEADCIFCASDQTNLCPKIRSTQGKGVMPDGTSRFSLVRDPSIQIYHFMGCSTFSEYTVISEISAAKISKDIPLESACLLGCGVSTGFGAVWNTTKVQVGQSVCVFGAGAVGLAVVQAAKMSGASKIIVVDTNSQKRDVSFDFGATHFILSKNDESVRQSILALCPWGVDYTYDATGNVNVMRTALEMAHRGWGSSCVIGVAAAGKEISTRPFQLVTGRKWMGTAFGGWKSRVAVPALVERVLSGEININHFITHRVDGVDNTNKAFEYLHSGDCLRTVVKY